MWIDSAMTFCRSLQPARSVIPGMITSRRDGGAYLAQRGVFINGKCICMRQKSEPES